MIFNTLAIATLLSISSCQKELGYTGFVDPDAAAEAQISLSTDKSCYLPRATVTFTANEMPSGAIYVRYMHLGKMVGEEQALSGTEWTWTAPEDDFKGYMAEVYQRSAEGENILATIAIDVSSDWSRFPRYGFLATFNEMGADACNTVIANLNRLHINGVQFQDWHWKHHWPLAQDKTTMAPLETYLDIANRSTSLETIKNYISSAHSFGMKAIFYNLCFGALDDAAEDGVREEWYIFKDSSHGTKDVHELGDMFKSSIYLVDPGNAEWQEYLGEKNDAVYENLAFDGYQIDQLGGRGSVYNYNGETVDLPEGYASFINAMKSRHPDKALIMNAVSNFGSERILSTGNVDFAYNEMWESENQFTDLRKAIEDNKTYGGEDMQTVFAAYMNYNKADNTGSFNTPGVLLTDAVIFALGGSHLEMGEHMLCKEYFPNSNLGMTSELRNSIISYYDFLTAYQNLLRDGGDFNDVAVSSADGKMNIKPWEPAVGNVVTLCKKAGDLQTIHLLNFSQANSTSWRDLDGSMPEPALITDAALDISTAEEVASVWMASPDIDGGACKVLPFSQEDGKLRISVPSLKYWDMIVIEYEN